MSLWIKTEEYKLGLQDRTESGDIGGEIPVPTQVLSNGEFNPSPENDTQRKIKAEILEVADELRKETTSPAVPFSARRRASRCRSRS